MPAWWLFEAIDQRTGNWEYLGGNAFSDLEYYLLCTISFSTVMPAIFETAELVSSFRWVKRFAAGPRLAPTPALNLSLFLGGLAMLALSLPLAQILLSLCLDFSRVDSRTAEPLARPPALLQTLQRGDWRLVASLALGAVICGFFWEMWNYYSYPKWVYHTPGAQFLHVFEMPLLGYGGYVPFALELCALKNFLWPGSPGLQMEAME